MQQSVARRVTRSSLETAFLSHVQAGGRDSALRLRHTCLLIPIAGRIASPKKVSWPHAPRTRSAVEAAGQADEDWCCVRGCVGMQEECALPKNRPSHRRTSADRPGKNAGSKNTTRSKHGGMVGSWGQVRRLLPRVTGAFRRERQRHCRPHTDGFEQWVGVCVRVCARMCVCVHARACVCTCV